MVVLNASGICSNDVITYEQGKTVVEWWADINMQHFNIISREDFDLERVPGYKFLATEDNYNYQVYFFMTNSNDVSP